MSWPRFDQVMTFSKKVIERPQFDDFTGLLKPFTNLSNLDKFEKKL